MKLFLVLLFTIIYNFQLSSSFQFNIEEFFGKQSYDDVPCYREAEYLNELVSDELDINHSTPIENLPKQWLWNDIDGVNYLTLIRNQHIPEYCGSCWAFAATSAISDRIKIMRKAAWPEINLSPQVLLSCDQYNDGCHGGDHLAAYQYMFAHKIGDETCSLYQARGHDNGLSCTSRMKCMDCGGKNHGGCWSVDNYRKYTVNHFARLQGEQAMMNEIHARGPITCSIADPPTFKAYKGGIYEDKTGIKKQTHAISVVGWGEENGVKYWLGRNSWGEYWGEKGLFRIVRGVDNLGIEEKCSYGVPVDTWTAYDEQQHHTVKKLEQEQQEVKEPSPSFLELLEDDEYPNELTEDIDLKEHVTTPRPHEYIKEEEIPKAWDWRNVNGTNYMSWTVNQHIPVYCGSCWAQCAMSTLADRVNIQRKNAWPPAAFSPQTIINCHGGGACGGGTALNVFKWAHEHKVPTVTCQQYIARNPKNYTCSPIQQCMDCAPPTYPNSTCSAVDKFPYVKVAQYGTVKGIHAVKAEIFARGPVTCKINSTKEFHSYKGGIYSQGLNKISFNHAIQVLGWGEENGKQYWIGRNSWGTYWGEQGYFRIRMDKYNLGIFRDCQWAVPEMHDE